jgi:hypothetical protein
MLVTDDARRCPFCTHAHALALHAWYFRWAILPDPDGEVKIPVRRLRCSRSRHTVSLLPDFCLPRRQHGPAVLGAFLAAFLLAGATLLGALRSVRREARGHAVAQALLAGFARRARPVGAYVAALRARPVEPPCAVPARWRSLALLLVALLEGFRDAGSAFVHHALRFHARFGVSLA